MNKTVLLFLLFVFISLSGISQDKKKLYNINLDPVEQFKEALVLAKESGKHVMIQIGGNWCPWCYRFHDFHNNDPELDSLMKADYVLINVNYDPKKSKELFTMLEFPQRFGFPVIVITDADGKRLHTQNSWYLEDGAKSYDREKFKVFLKAWTKKAVDPDSYKK